MLSILALGMLVAVGAAYDETDRSDFSSRGGDRHDFGDSDRHFGDRDKHHDWLNPGASIHIAGGILPITNPAGIQLIHTPIIRPTITQHL